MKTIEKKLAPGKWKIDIGNDGVAGYQVVSCELKGLRGRGAFLRRATLNEFFERHPRNNDNKPIDSPPLMRATPTMYLVQGTIIYLWPNPASAWTLQINMQPRST